MDIPHCIPRNLNDLFLNLCHLWLQIFEIFVDSILMGGMGDPPVPVGDSPTGMEARNLRMVR
jgi:hypothetical protein